MSYAREMKRAHIECAEMGEIDCDLEWDGIRDAIISEVIESAIPDGDTKDLAVWYLGRELQSVVPTYRGQGKGLPARIFGEDAARYAAQRLTHRVLGGIRSTERQALSSLAGDEDAFQELKETQRVLEDVGIMSLGCTIVWALRPLALDTMIQAVDDEYDILAPSTSLGDHALLPGARPLLMPTMLRSMGAGRSRVSTVKAMDAAARPFLRQTRGDDIEITKALSGEVDRQWYDGDLLCML